MNIPKTSDEKNWPDDVFRTPESGAQVPTELLDFSIEGKFYKAKNAEAASALHKAFEPDWASPPGDTIREWMNENEVADGLMAGYLDISLAKFASLLTGEDRVDDHIAFRLAQVIGPDVKFWLKREYQYRQALRRQNCCDSWPALATSFSWSYKAAGKGVLVTPCIAAGDNRYLVNYCPSCGKPARDREIVR